MKHNHNLAHRVKATFTKYLVNLYGIAKGIGWFISDIKFKYKMALYKNEQCSSCFGKLTTKKPYGGFDYKGKTFYICRGCYDKLHNKN